MGRAKGAQKRAAGAGRGSHAPAPFFGHGSSLVTPPLDPDRPAPRDVRSRGFAARADVEEVERFLAAKSAAQAAEQVPLVACAGRVLAEATP